MPRFFVGLDLGQVRDPTAVAVIEESLPTDQPPGKARPRYDVRYLRRYPLGTSYPAIVAAVKTLVATAPLPGCLLGIDATGVGRPVVDMFRQATLRATLKPIVFTAGHAVTTDDDGTLRVPKKELVSALQVLLQSHRLRIAEGLPDAKALIKELLAFRSKITLGATETLEAWREQDHDDLVFAVAMPVWLAQRTPPAVAARAGGRRPEVANLRMLLQGQVPGPTPFRRFF